ncbi:PRC-barrel domain-containing protein [Halococcus hamelinensis]|jgi:sporulation protein YlmC with PRC-barrel domain|uniref:PRC-barrel domain-containing protein n=1 Tax=Halococcus hamelinensis 100A6 TaxID=1132509 RepID=M0M191_9EURY|nr:PRC-barrel domain-containing protein [Halococcus hamelinensis]EMA39188.1 PRC-barrel domain-containing protein [Halococcus hamelinensis 100A6]
MDATQTEIGTLVGRDVYSTNGTYVGEIEDVRLDLDTEFVTGLAVGGLNREALSGRARGAAGVIVPFRWVRSVGDIVLVSDVIERLREPDEESEAEATA